MARSHGDGKDGGTLRRLAAEVGQDRAALLDIMATLGIKVRRYKVGAAWIGEKAGRLKFNGRLFARSPLSNLEEPEMLRLGVEGKAAGWRTLRTLADTAPSAARSRSDRCHRSCPRAVTLPLFGRSRPDRIDSRVDLPLPEGPMSRTISPR